MRRVTTVKIDRPGRDLGRVYEITEMPATQAEDWAARAFLAMGRAGIDVPEDIAASGLSGLAYMGMNALKGLSWADAKPLMDEMFTCIKIIPDPSRAGFSRRLIEDDCEEVATRFTLRMEVLRLHMDFLVAAVQSNSASSAAVTAPASSSIM